MAASKTKTSATAAKKTATKAAKPAEKKEAKAPPKPGAGLTVEGVLKNLHEKYPNARYELNWDTPFQLLIATILAAQCTDARVNKVTATLFKKYPDPQAFVDAEMSELEKDLEPTGFYKQKAKRVKGTCQMLVEKFKSEVPNTMDKITQLPGVERKTGNVVLTQGFNLPTGIIVDTHVKRISPRMGLSTKEDPVEIEKDLMKIVPKDEWIFFGPAMVLHGRYVCVANKPKCDECVFCADCPKKGV